MWERFPVETTPPSVLDLESRSEQCDCHDGQWHGDARPVTAGGGQGATSLNVQVGERRADGPGHRRH